jgi:hypothetical protein
MRNWRLWCAVVASLAGAIRIPAQAGNGQLAGEVRDASGGLIPKAKVSARMVDSGFVSSTESSSSGIYLLVNLRPGDYTLTIEADGFNHFVQHGIQLVTGERARVDVTLTVGSTKQIVTVNGDAPLLRTTGASIDQTIPNNEISELPLNGRTFITLVGLSAGVALPPGSQLPRLNGGRPRVNEYLYDGISVLQPEPGQVAYFPIVDAIQEFQLTTNNPPAEFGRFNGGVVNLSTKSGSNSFHGTVFGFLRNEALNARNLFQPATFSLAGKPKFRRNQFGGVLGGPVVHEKTFFFIDYQGTRQNIARTRTSTVPTLLQRQGIFTESVGGKPVQIFDPATTVILPSGSYFRQAFANQTIPTGRIDPVALTLLNRFPLPTSSGTANNYKRTAGEPDNQDQFDVRLDHRFSANDSAFTRYSYFKDFTSPVTPLPDGSGTLTAGTTSNSVGPQDTLGQSFAANYVHLLRPAATNELRFGYTRRSISRLALLLSASPSESLDLPGIPTNGAFNTELPQFLLGGYQQLGPAANTDSLFRTDVTEMVDTVALQKGRHTVKFGGELRFYRLDILQPPSPTGQFTFSNLFTNNPSVQNSGNPLASFLLGQVQLFSIDLQQINIRPRAWVNEYFLQDDWRLSSRFTLSAGVRYTLNLPSTEMDNQGAIFNLRTQQFDYLGKNGFPRTARRLHWRDFGPRLGLACQLAPTLVVRSGYGLTWFDQAGITTPFTMPQFPFLQTVSQRTLDNVNPAFVLSSGPDVQPIPAASDAGLGQGVFSVDRGQTSGYVQQWNLALQWAVMKNLSVEANYAGSKGTHIGVPDTNLNQLPVADLTQGSALLKAVANPFYGEIPANSSIGGKTISTAQLMKPYPRFTTVSLFRNNVGNTDYHAFQLKLEKRFDYGLYLLVSYTRSKLIDDASSVFDASVLTGPVANFPVADSYNRRIEQDVSNGDMPNAFAGSWTYEIPVGKNRRWKPRGPLGVMAGGWNFVGIATIQSGLPLTVNQITNNLSFAGFGTQRPNCVSSPTPAGFAPGTAEWFDVSAFQVNSAFALGTCSRNPVRGPNFRDLDLGFLKYTPLHEQLSLEFRAEIFNLTNTPPLAAPNAIVGAPGFGSITSAGDPRVIQFGLKLAF